MNFNPRVDLVVAYINTPKANWCKSERWHHLFHLFHPYRRLMLTHSNWRLKL